MPLPKHAAAPSKPSGPATTEGFYSSDLVIKTYDLLTEQANQQISGDTAFYRACAERFGGPVLELGVGTGRIAWPLAEAGHEVVGIDRSTGMLAAAELNGEGRDDATRKRLALVASDITSFELGRRFSLALVPFSTFQHLTLPDEQRSCLENTRRHLEADGRLVIDVFDPVLDACVPDAESPNPDREAIDRQSGNKFRRRSIARSNDPVRQTFTETFVLERFDESDRLVERVEATHSLRWATRQEMIYLFELSGFEVDEEYSDFDGSPPTYGKRQIWVVKPAGGREIGAGANRSTKDHF